MLVIRLTRTGKAHDPHYRLVVQEKRSKLNGKAIDIVGHYHPAHPAKELVVDQDKVRAWLAKGAQTSDTVTNLLVKVGVLTEAHKVHNFYTPKPKEEAPAKAEVSAPVAEEEIAEAADVEETQVEESTAEEVAEVEATAEEAPEEPATEEVAVETTEEKEEEKAA